jgi:dTDP-L-rhamnose 4-epimerase
VKVLVTGGAGFIGSHAVDALVEAGADVVCVDSLDQDVYHQAPDYLNPAVDYCFADLRTWRPDTRVDGVEAVVHFAAIGGVSRAAREPGNVIEGNVYGTARLLEAMRTWRHLRTVIVASSFSVYGASYLYRCPSCHTARNGDRALEDLERGIYEVLCEGCRVPAEILPLDASATPDPLETYGASKYMQELCFRGFDCCPVRFLRQSSVYGTRLRLDDGEATIIARIAGWLRAGSRPILFEDGQQIRDWVHVDDVAAAVLALVSGADAPPVINVCTGVPTTLAEACVLIADAMGSALEPDVVGGYRLGDMRHCLGDPSNLGKLLGRDPTPFAVGARLTFGGTPGSSPDRSEVLVRKGGF